MPPLAFQLVWLFGAAASGDKAARAALGACYPTLVAELSWDLEVMRSGIVNNKQEDICIGFKKLMGGVAKMSGKTCTQTIVENMQREQSCFAARTAIATSHLLPREKLLPLLKEMVHVLEQNVPTQADEVPLP